MGANPFRTRANMGGGYRGTLNETTTRIQDARRERLDFLGYSFGPHHCRKDGH
jgi:hypothetical protein